MQLTHLQVGDESEEVNLIVSTLLELERLVPFLKACKEAKRDINVLYGLPLAPSQVDRLGQAGRDLG